MASKRPRLKPNDLKLAIFIAFGSSDGLLVSENTDTEGIRRAISLAISQRKLFFAYAFGREFHDLVARRHPEKTSLNNAEAVEILRELPVGVYQVGRYTVGPFGCQISETTRSFSPSRAVPSYLCSDETCLAVHSIVLETAQDAAINKAIPVVSQYVRDREGGRYDENARLLREAVSARLRAYVLYSPEGIFEVLADAFTEEELRLVAANAYRVYLKEQPHLRRDIAKKTGVMINDPTDFVADMARPELLQLLLLLDDQRVMAAVDRVVRQKAVPTADYELRIPMIMRSQGPYDMSPEVGSRGIRFVGSPDSGLVAARLFALLHELYYASETLSPEDLAYRLEAPSTVAEQELLGHAVRELAPEQILEELVLRDRKAAGAAAEFLGVTDWQDLTREEHLRHLLWKLGVPVEVVFEDLTEAAVMLELLSSSVDAGALEPTVRGHISNLFKYIEEAQQRALQFCIWASASDHYLEAEGFLYDPEDNGDLYAFLDEHAPAEEGKLLSRRGGNTLAPLAAGFARLSKALASLDAADHARPMDQYPLQCRLTKRPFAFASRISFFNLSAAAQTEYLNTLRRLSSCMSDATVVKVRNAGIHGNNAFPSRVEVAFAVEKIKEWRLLLHESGLYPRVYRLVSEERDVLGRETMAYESEGQRLSLYRPSWPIAPRLPAGLPQLVVVPMLQTPASGPLRFRLKPRPGTDPYWEGWPVRWKVQTDYGVRERTDKTATSEQRLG